MKNPLAFMDDALNRVTMYRLMLYYLSGLIAVALAGSLFGLVRFSPLSIIFSFALIAATCWIANEVFARLFKAPFNAESTLITALILVLIVSPISFADLSAYPFMIASSILAIASKFMLAVDRKHIFNPAAFGVAAASLCGLGAASWWAGGNAYLLAFTVAGGLLVLRKIRRFDLGLSFCVVAFAAILATTHASHFATVAKFALIDTPLLFFAFVMISEPSTTPPTRIKRIGYGILTGFLFTPSLHVGSIYSTPELALVVANAFSYAASPKGRRTLALVRVEKTGNSSSDFVFESDKPIRFSPGQYAEWTLAHKHADSRGIRRYFTIASAPSEREIRLGVKFYDPPSSFKRSLAQMKPGDKLTVSNVAGDFTMPADASQKLAFIAGGIGITPFRSMFQHLIDSGQKRDIVLLYSNREASDISYRDVFQKAHDELGITTIYAVTGEKAADGSSYRGKIDAELISEQVPDYKERTFYVSGPRAMIVSFEKTLRELGIPKTQVKTDFFPGFT